MRLRASRRPALFASAAAALALAPTLAMAQDTGDDDDESTRPVSELTITARRLDAARAAIEPSLGASLYSLSNDAIELRPGGETTRIATTLLQAPGVAQDGSGRLHVRQSSGDLQYRINGVFLPEGLSDLGESLSPRLADKVDLVTGALPAQYGLQLGGVVNVTTKSGVYMNGGQLELYGGGQGKIEPAVEWGNTVGGINTFISTSFLRNDAGLAPPDGRKPIHDRTDQTEGLLFLDRTFGKHARVSFIGGLADERFRIPNPHGLNSATYSTADDTFRRPLTALGVTNYPSEAGTAHRRETTRYGLGSFLWSEEERWSVQASVFQRYSSIRQTADPVGDLLFGGVAESSEDVDVAQGWQLDGVYNLGEAHTLRAGILEDESLGKGAARSLVLPVDAAGNQTSTVPRTPLDRQRFKEHKDSIYLQDEWRVTDWLTVNAGVRHDRTKSFRRDEATSPRVNVVLTPAFDLTIHAGYARYFLPAVIDGIADSPRDLAATTGRTPTSVGGRLLPETDDYWDAGVQKKWDHITVGVDAYVRDAKDLIDRGEFLASNEPRTFNYAGGRLRGMEFSLLYGAGPLSGWANLAVARAEGRGGVVSNQFYLTSAQLAYAATHHVRLATDQTVTASGGASYKFGDLRVSGQVLYGSGYRGTAPGGAPNGRRLADHAQVDLAAVYRLTPFENRPLELRMDIVNVFNASYAIHDGSGLGDGRPQYGPRRGVFVGFEQSF